MPPLDAGSLDRMALRYVERFATTRGKLADYLKRKLRERGWAGECDPDPAIIAEHMAELGYIDDRGYAEGKAAAMARRGLGARRVNGALRAAGIGEEDAAAVAPAISDRAEDAALAFARKRRIGPFADAPPDRPLREKQLAAMVRAGHDFTTARRILEMTAEDLVEQTRDFPA